MHGPIVNSIPNEPYPELPSVLSQLVAGVRSVLGGSLVGAYLVGSLATGDFDLDSDVDFLIVTEGDLEDASISGLQELHARIRALPCYPAQHLEGSYVSRRILAREESVGVEPLWYLDNGSTALERSLHDNQWHVRWILRERGITLVGPDPKMLVQPVPVEALRQEALAALCGVAGDFAAEMEGPLGYYNSRFGQSFAVLNGCRILHTLKTGTVQSKLAGATWAKQALDPRWTGLIEQAWEERKGVRFCIKIGQPAEPALLRETLDFLRYLVAEGER